MSSNPLSMRLLFIISVTSTIVRSQHNDGLMVRSTRIRQCKARDEACAEDCECCGYDKDPTVRCEKRHKQLGYRCYTSVELGGRCINDVDCRSQKCDRNCCVPFFAHGSKASICPIGDNKFVKPVKGTIESNICGCQKTDDSPTAFRGRAFNNGPSIKDAMKVVDGDNTTIYVNDWAIDGGVELKPLHNKALHTIEICNADDCPECDPTCYKIEGNCKFKHMYETIQEGSLDLPIERNQCVTIRLRGKRLYSSYKITFPCQRGPCRDSCAGTCHAPAQLNPSLGPCRNYVDKGDNLGSMSLITSKPSKDGQKTIFYYEIDNIQLGYMKLAWKGDCMIDHYNVYKNVNRDQLDLLDDGPCDENSECFVKCGNDFVSDKEDKFLCMQGLMIMGGIIWAPGKYIVKVEMFGNIKETTMLPYGMFSGREAKTAYGKVESPVCPDVLCPATCPLKLNEITLYTEDCDSEFALK